MPFKFVIKKKTPDDMAVRQEQSGYPGRQGSPGTRSATRLQNWKVTGLYYGRQIAQSSTLAQTFAVKLAMDFSFDEKKRSQTSHMVFLDPFIKL